MRHTGPAAPLLRIAGVAVRFGGRVALRGGAGAALSAVYGVVLRVRLSTLPGGVAGGARKPRARRRVARVGSAR